MSSYTQTDQLLHLHCQVIAKTNRTFVPQKEDDSHTNLAYDAVGDRILGRWIKTPAGPRMLAFHLTDQTYQWLGARGEILQAVAAIGKRSAEAEMELVPALREAGLAGAGFTEPLHFEINDYAFAGEPFATLDNEGLESWRYYRMLGQQACAAALRHLGASGEARIWPHHFDTGVYAELPSGFSLGFGWAMEDDMVGEPYAYATGYRKGEMLSVADFSDLAQGRWVNTKNWKGGVLPLSAIPMDDVDAAKAVYRKFIQQTIAALQA